MRIILYTGKGGVGKTSVAAATALRCAELGYKTIILSTDAAHSLGDSFEVKLGNEPEPIASNLWGQETEMSRTLERHWTRIQEWFKALLAWRGIEEIVAEEIAILPGMEEGANLLYIVDHYDGGKYDVIVVDCAPTADTLRFLSFPEILRWWMEKMFPIGRTAAGLARPFIKPLLNVPLPEDEVFRAAEDLFEELYRIRTLLTNAEVTSVRLVLNPEKMVIKEAQRAFTYLNLYGYPTDLVVCNRMIPEGVTDEHFEFWKESQAKYHKLIEESFAPLPILDVPLFDQEVTGISMLRRMGEVLFGEEDPSRIFFHGRPREIEKADGYYELIIPLPFVEKAEISLTQNGDELLVQVGRYKRNLVLPRTLAGLPIEGARFEDGRLRIRFREELKSKSSKG
ncbi:MAG: ArsA family ATPase [Chloroflexi bacterium]|nr:MAG: ArsA family ATPase [Chloroflexota bacterium]